jgi:hypothetical protein
VQRVETSSFVEARRCRCAQYRGRAAELSLNGSRFFGMVQSVQEDRSRSPQRWIITIVPTVEKPPLVGWRYRSRWNFKKGVLVNWQYQSGTMKSVLLRSCPNAGAAKIASDPT